MHTLYLVSVFVHILAATIWVGGMAFLVLVVVPWLRASGQRAQAGALLRDTGIRFRSVGWVCFGLIALTATFNAYYRGVRLGDLVRASFVSSTFGTALLLKLGLFVLVLALSGYHDFVVGPRATRALVDARPEEAEPLRRRASLLGRLNALLALALYAVAVVLVRGC